ncbi:SDR family NAD(P)-dependent oxidoreductase, partial [Mycobacterium sp. E740]|uniref:SDR family NAD(P)-dependent oxidoreductase n=1 Tax=Mycobacterium sp. E740 TaxID=1834149 RepID=UPI0035118D86
MRVGLQTADRTGQDDRPAATALEDVRHARLDGLPHTAEVDVRDYDALKAAVDAGVEQMGRLDIIVANAGIGNGGQTLDKTSETDWAAMIDVNLGGVWKTVKAGVPHILEGGRGGS